jgi:23S rRNA U2552 (ribose-2'-O)-methylase RlmE/FtsJ
MALVSKAPEHIDPKLADQRLTEINLYVNRKLADILMAYKNMINFYYCNKSWDKYKKLSNEYEFIYSFPSCDFNVSNYIPTSRSFFKMWEILHDLKDIFGSSSPMKCVFLAEGPGGFAEAVMKYRNTVATDPKSDEFHGMTLKCDSNKCIPEWKLKDTLMHISYGIDGTGNLYNIDNIRFLAKLTGGKNSVDLITADGGFDFSSDFNNQEEQCFKLITCEILSALYLQKQGGVFVLKIFDVFHDKTLRLLQILYSNYEKVHIVKPFTSRPANSEKYVVCEGFKNNKTDRTKDVLEMCIKNIHNADEYLRQNIPIDPVTMQKIIRFNTYAVMRQVHYIQKTIELIRTEAGLNGGFHSIIERNKKYCQEWCSKYKI